MGNFVSVFVLKKQEFPSGQNALKYGFVRIGSCLLLVLLGLAFSACSKDRNVLFDLPFELRFEIPAGLNPLDRHFFLIRDVPTNLENFKDQFQAGDKVFTLHPSTAVLTSITGDVDWTFLREVEVSIFQNNDPNDDQAVFLSDNVPLNAGRNVVVLPFEDDVRDLLEEDRVDFKVSLRLRGTTPTFIESIVSLSFSAEE